MSSTGERFRSMAGMEEVFWHAEHLVFASHACLARIAAHTEVGRWRAAWSLLQARHPILQASIVKRDGERPAFVRRRRDPLPLHLAPGWLALSEARIMEQALARSFGSGAEELLRLTLVHGAHHCILVLQAHHSLFDGRSALFLLEDLLAAYRGEAGVDRPFAPHLPQLLDLEAADPAPPPAPAEAAAPPQARLLTSCPVHSAVIAAAPMRRLLARARAEGTTVHGALMAALATAGRELSPRWRERTLSLTIPVELRAELGLPTAFGMLIYAAFCTLAPEHETQPFWTRARTARGLLGLEARREHARRFNAALLDATAQDLPSEAVMGALRRLAPVPDLMITNHAGYGFQACGFEVEALIAATASGGPETQTVSAVAHGGRLHLALVGQPIEGLLERAVELLIAAA